jgi:hypothetical protein
LLKHRAEHSLLPLAAKGYEELLMPQQTLQLLILQHGWRWNKVRSVFTGMGILGLLLSVPVQSWANPLEPEVMAPEVIANVQSQALSNSESNSDRPSISDVVRVSQIAPLNSVPLNQSKTQVSEQPIRSNPALSQVTSVSQLSDVSPTDWAFQALQSLVERYGCIVGYPDSTYKGSRAITRYEFAAGLNACLDRISELIASSTADLATEDDLATMRRLQEEFAAELATLRGRVDSLEARTAFLEAHQFSTTTQLRGDALFIVADTFGDRANNTPQDDTNDDTETFAAYRLRLTFQTSFTGTDQLTAGLQSNSIPNLGASTGTHMTRFGFDGTKSETDTVYLDRLYYRFPVGNQLTVWLGTRALQPAVFLPTLNGLIGGNTGATSRFAAFNHTVYRPGFDGAGAAFAYKFNNQLQLGLGYIVDDTQVTNSAEGQGLLQGNNLTLAQLTYSPSRDFDIALTYGRKYFGTNTGFNLTGGVGSSFARNPFEQNATVSDNFGVEVNWRAAASINLSGWFGYTRAHQVSGADNTATIIHGAIGVAFPDLLAEGNLGGLIVGIPPKVTSNDYQSAVGGLRREDLDTSLHLEAFYTFRLTDNVSVTPDIYLITAPEHNDANDVIWVGSIRTNFSF